MKEIEEAVKSFKAKNGNKNYDNQEMLIYIMTKLDNLPCSKHGESIIKALTWVKVFKFYIPISLTIISMIIALLVLK